MGYKPDYGLKLLQDGVSKDVDIHFSQFILYSIDLLGFGKYSAMAEIPYDNLMYALSLDFTNEQLQQMLLFAPESSIIQITEEINAGLFASSSIDIIEPFMVDITVSLGDIQKNEYETYVPFVVKNVNYDCQHNNNNNNNNNNKLSEENEDKHTLCYTKEELSRVLDSVKLHIIDTNRLYNLLNLVSNKENESNNFYKECLFALDLICILEAIDFARSVYDEEDEPPLDSNIYNYYLELISELEIDFKLLILLAGEDFIQSDYYEYDGELGKEQVLKYLIHEHYGSTIRKLKLHYGHTQILLLELIKDLYFYNSYIEIVDDMTSVADCFDYPDIVRLYNWADVGFYW